MPNCYYQSFKGKESLLLLYYSLLVLLLFATITIFNMVWGLRYTWFLPLHLQHRIDRWIREESIMNLINIMGRHVLNWINNLSLVSSLTFFSFLLRKTCYLFYTYMPTYPWQLYIHLIVAVAESRWVLVSSWTKKKKEVWPRSLNEWDPLIWQWQWVWLSHSHCHWQCQCYSTALLLQLLLCHYSTYTTTDNHTIESDHFCRIYLQHLLWCSHGTTLLADENCSENAPQYFHNL